MHELPEDIPGQTPDETVVTGTGEEQFEMEPQRQSLSEYKGWAKQRALTYVEDGNLSDAVRSMMSDLRKDDRIPDSQQQFVAVSGAELLHKGTALTREEVLGWIEGF